MSLFSVGLNSFLQACGTGFHEPLDIFTPFALRFVPDTSTDTTGNFGAYNICDVPYGTVSIICMCTVWSGLVLDCTSKSHRRILVLNKETGRSVHSCL
jgi:hypothetical protein